MRSGKISRKVATRFDQDGFYGLEYFSEKNGSGIGVVEVNIDGVHPEKKVDIAVRIYRIEDGSGNFNIDNVSYTAEIGDVFVVQKSYTYSYSGKMKLFEINIR